MNSVLLFLNKKRLVESSLRSPSRRAACSGLRPSPGRLRRPAGVGDRKRERKREKERERETGSQGVPGVPSSSAFYASRDAAPDPEVALSHDATSLTENATSFTENAPQQRAPKRHGTSPKVAQILPYSVAFLLFSARFLRFLSL